MILGMNLAFSSPESYDEAVLVGEEGLAICRELNDRAGIAQALNALGELVRNHGDYERAAVLYEESLALAREIGDRLREQMMSMNLGYVAYHHGNYHLAETLFTEGIGLAVELDLKPDLVKNFGFLAGAIGQQGQVERAARLMAICEKLTADIGIVHQPADQLEYDHYKASIREKMGDAAFRKAWDEGLALSEKGLDWVTTYALKGEYQDV
jgi:tetratricopeptide (TPR) repeat protein